MRKIVGALILCLLPSCKGEATDVGDVQGDGTSADARDESTSDDAAVEPGNDASVEPTPLPDAGVDAATAAPHQTAEPGVNPRLVTIELPRVAYRPVRLDEQGVYQWGNPVPLDGVQTCVIERRDAYAIFEPYQALDEPICTITEADQKAKLSGIPANSDLTITVSKDGYLPLVMTHRVENFDLPVNINIDFMRTLLFKPEQAELFTSPVGAEESSEPGLLTVEYGMFGIAFEGPGDGGEFMSSPFVPFHVAQQAEFQLRLAPAGPISRFDVPPTQLLLQAAPGIYRVQANHPRAYCEPMGVPMQLTLWGMGTDTAGEMELRVLPGHVSSLFALCLCYPPGPDAVSLDVPSCTFAGPEPLVEPQPPIEPEPEVDASVK